MNTWKITLAVSVAVLGFAGQFVSNMMISEEVEVSHIEPSADVIDEVQSTQLMADPEVEVEDLAFGDPALSIAQEVQEMVNTFRISNPETYFEDVVLGEGGLTSQNLMATMEEMVQDHLLRGGDLSEAASAVEEVTAGYFTPVVGGQIVPAHVISENYLVESHEILVKASEIMTQSQELVFPTSYEELMALALMAPHLDTFVADGLCQVLFHYEGYTSFALRRHSIIGTAFQPFVSGMVAGVSYPQPGWILYKLYPPTTANGRLHCRITAQNP